MQFWSSSFPPYLVLISSQNFRLLRSSLLSSSIRNSFNLLLSVYIVSLLVPPLPLPPNGLSSFYHSSRSISFSHFPNTILFLSLYLLCIIPVSLSCWHPNIFYSKITYPTHSTLLIPNFLILITFIFLYYFEPLTTSFHMSSKKRNKIF